MLALNTGLHSLLVLVVDLHCSFSEYVESLLESLKWPASKLKETVHSMIDLHRFEFVIAGLSWVNKMVSWETNGFVKGSCHFLVYWSCSWPFLQEWCHCIVNQSAILGHWKSVKYFYTSQIGYKNSNLKWFVNELVWGLFVSPLIALNYEWEDIE